MGTVVIILSLMGVSPEDPKLEVLAVSNYQGQTRNTENNVCIPREGSYTSRRSKFDYFLLLFLRTVSPISKDLITLWKCL